MLTHLFRIRCDLRSFSFLPSLTTAAQCQQPATQLRLKSLANHLRHTNPKTNERGRILPIKNYESYKSRVNVCSGSVLRASVLCVSEQIKTKQNLLSVVEDSETQSPRRRPRLRDSFLENLLGAVEDSETQSPRRCPRPRDLFLRIQHRDKCVIQHRSI